MVTAYSNFWPAVTTVHPKRERSVLAYGFRDSSPSGRWLWEHVVEAPHIMAHGKKKEQGGNQRLGCNLQRSFPSDLLPPARLHLPKAPELTNTDGSYGLSSLPRGPFQIETVPPSCEMTPLGSLTHYQAFLPSPMAAYQHARTCH